MVVKFVVRIIPPTVLPATLGIISQEQSETANAYHAMLFKAVFSVLLAPPVNFVIMDIS